MTAMIFAAAAALLMTELFSRTKRPKLYALLNAAAGIAVLFAAPPLFGTAPPETGVFAAAVSAALGAPGAALYLLLPLLINGG